MSKPKVVILGSTGMLGSITLDSFEKSGNFELIATYRNKAEAESLIAAYPSVDFRLLDAETSSVENIKAAINGAEWVVNAIGVIKPYIHDDNPNEVERAIRVNSLFPHLLGEAASSNSAKVIQIATDCVYSGEKGNYVESDVHDALDVYGKSKSLGESYQEVVHNIRCSIIGPELKGHLSLMDWFLGQEKDTEVNGFTNHQWNGVTTLHYARLCQGIIKNNVALPHIQHIVPGNLITKANLLKAFGKEYNRADITVNSVEAPKVIDRTLSTENEKANLEIWKAAGYDTPPTVEQMVAEIATYDFPTGKK
jgi:dTDP-4-dehydrorhamnose reductase